MKMKKAMKIAIWIIVGVIFVGTFVYLFINSGPKKEKFELVSPTKGTIERTTILNGKIEPRDEIQIKPQISGIISEVMVEAGQTVHAGDVIAKIKVVPEEGSLSAAKSRIENAKISLDDITSRYNRNKMLYDKKVISREEFETSSTELSKAREELKAAQDSYSIIKDGISQENATGSNTLVRATITGLVLDVPVKVGSSVIQANTMNEGTTIATVADMSNLIFKGKMDETEVGKLHVGMPMNITVGALPSYRSDAVIEYISPKAVEENGANSFEVKAAVKADGNSELRSGYSANATVSIQKAENVLTIPESVLEFEGEKTFVYIAGDTVPPYNFKRVQIITGVSDGINVEVKSGLKANVKLRGNKVQPDMPQAPNK